MNIYVIGTCPECDEPVCAMSTKNWQVVGCETDGCDFEGGEVSTAEEAITMIVDMHTKIEKRKK